jgi:hypothetical protein
MKPTAILVGALAAVASAAPTKVEERNAAFGGNFGFDVSGVNNLQFANLDLQYLAAINGFGGFNNLQGLAINNGFNFNQFGGLFNNDVFDVSQLLALQQLVLFDQLASFQVFQQFDLSSLLFNQLNFGLINNVFGFNFNSIIDQALIPQISAVVSQGGE